MKKFHCILVALPFAIAPFVAQSAFSNDLDGWHQDDRVAIVPFALEFSSSAAEDGMEKAYGKERM